MSFLDAAIREYREGKLCPLTSREKEVLLLVAEGLSDAEIAQRLWISLFTAMHHVQACREKCGVNSRFKAVVLARQRGWIG